MKIQHYITAFVAVLALSTTGCDGKDCSEPPDPVESEERFLERVEGYMDEADADSDQTEKVVAIAKSLTPVRATMRKQYEPHRTAIVEEMLSESPDIAVIDRGVEEAAEAMLDYADKVVERGMKAHDVLTATQRRSLTEELAEPRDPFELGWKENAAVDLFLFDIDATDVQKVMVRDELVEVEREVRDVQKKQHAVRLVVLDQIRASTPDADLIKKKVREGGSYSVALIKEMARTYVNLMSKLDAKQRAKAKGRLSALKRCT